MPLRRRPDWSVHRQHGDDQSSIDTRPATLSQRMSRWQLSRSLVALPSARTWTYAGAAPLLDTSGESRYKYTSILCRARTTAACIHSVGLYCRTSRTHLHTAPPAPQAALHAAGWPRSLARHARASSAQRLLKRFFDLKPLPTLRSSFCFFCRGAPLSLANAADAAVLTFAVASNDGCVAASRMHNIA